MFPLPAKLMEVCSPTTSQRWRSPCPGARRIHLQRGVVHTAPCHAETCLSPCFECFDGTPRPKAVRFVGPLGPQRRLKQCRAARLPAPSCKGAGPSSLVGIALKPVRKATDHDINSKKQEKKIFTFKSEKFSHLCLRLVCVIQSSGNCELDWKLDLPGPLTKLGKLSP